MRKAISGVIISMDQSVKIYNKLVILLPVLSTAAFTLAGMLLTGCARGINRYGDTRLYSDMHSACINSFHAQATTLENTLFYVFIIGVFISIAVLIRNIVKYYNEIRAEIKSRKEPTPYTKNQNTIMWIVSPIIALVLIYILVKFVFPI